MAGDPEHAGILEGRETMAMDPTLTQIEQRVNACQARLADIANEIPLCDTDAPGGAHDPGASPHNNPPNLAAARLLALSLISHALQDLVQCHDELSHGGGGHFT